jgi:peptidoglycan hydrolase-like protein with peptidoglycan-binding domain
MTTVRHLSRLMALGALLALSAYGGNTNTAQAADAPPPPAAPPPPSAAAAAPAPAMTGGGPTVTPAVTPHVVREVQTVLRNAGAHHLTVDGRDGSRTRLFVRRWQHDHNLPATGIIDAATLQSMNITN